MRCLSLLLLLSACSAPEHQVVIVFPDQTTMENTTRVTLTVLVTDLPKACDLLRYEQGVARASTVLDRSQSFPFDAQDGIGVGKLDDGSHAFLVTADNRSGQRFLTGCSAAEISTEEAVTVRVVLAEFRGCCGGGAGCSAANQVSCYDGAGSTDGIGVCAPGVAGCVDGFFTTCVGQVLPATETCNGKDDDCDTLVDESACGGVDLGLDGAGDFQTDLGSPCTADGAFECLPDDSARQCVGGRWVSLGSCPLGCSETDKACRVPSNIEPSLIGAGAGDHVSSSVTINTDTGEITGVRPAGTGLDSSSGIYFETVAQPGAPGLGVFSLKKLAIPATATVKVVGSRALVVLLSDSITIDGVIDVSTSVKAAGPGGFAGGNPDAVGQGPGGGGTTTGVPDGDYCIGGGGGGGHGDAGGAGGTSDCAAPNNLPGGSAGKANGTADLVPLAGGGGGAGSVVPVGVTTATPGSGGGGGGAIQIVAAVAITVGPGGGINAGGGGGGKTISASGAGGGAGGAILLEAPVVTIGVNGILAANGGGGGGGDCI